MAALVVAKEAVTDCHHARSMAELTFYLSRSTAKGTLGWLAALRESKGVGGLSAQHRRSARQLAPAGHHANAAAHHTHLRHAPQQI